MRFGGKVWMDCSVIPMTNLTVIGTGVQSSRFTKISQLFRPNACDRSIAMANQDFYEKMGFETTSVIKGDDVLFEIPASVSMDLLKLRGLIDG